MVKNLRVYNNGVIKKLTIHKLIYLLGKELNFKVKNLEITFINSDEIISINKTYLNHKSSTDIITFDYSNSDSFLDGEILISLDDAQNNSKRFNIPFYEELMRLVIHGVLHLLGYKDKKIKERKIMKAKENFFLRKYKFLVNKMNL